MCSYETQQHHQGISLNAIKWPPTEKDTVFYELPRTWLCFIQNTTPLSSWLNKPFVHDLIPINILVPRYIKNGTWHFITTVRHGSFLHIPYYVLHLKDALFNHTITAVTVQSLLFMRTSWCLSASCSKEITQRWPWNENEWGLCVL